MEDLPGDVRADSRVVVEHLRSLARNAPGSYPVSYTHLTLPTNREV